MHRTRTLAALLIVIAAAPSLRATPRVVTTLHNERGEVAALYNSLSVLALDDARQQYRVLTPSMQQDLWAVRLELFLEEHPSLTADQRAVVFEGFGLLAAGIIDEARNSRDAALPAYQALAQLEYRAKTVLGRALALEAFATLGVTTAGPTASRGKLKSFYSKTPPCDCSGESDWCDTVTNPTPKCRPDPCVQMDGCGTFWLYICNGICGPGAPNP